MRALSWINFILGLWLIVSAFVVSRMQMPAVGEEIVLGIIIAVFAYASAVSAPGTGGVVVSWIVALAGLWTLLAPSVISYPPSLHAALVNDVTVGIIVLVLGFANAVYRNSPVRVSGR